jgi:hypothetical protein
MTIDLDLKAITRDAVAAILSSEVANVTFKKSDGSERVMKCTLIDEYIPNPELDLSRTSTRKVNEAVLPVWDIDKNAWRSFRIDSVKAIQVV